MDKITLERIETAHPKVRGELKKIYQEICSRLTGRAMCRFAFVYRTFAEQEAIYAQGRTKPGAIVTNAKGGQSYHNYGLAVDIVLIEDKDGNGSYESATWHITKDFDGDGSPDWEEIDFVFKMYGWEGLYKADGKRWDFPHFQKTLGYRVVDLLANYNAKKVDANNYVNI